MLALTGDFDGRRAFELFLTGRISGHLWNKLFRRSLALSIQFWRIQVHSDQAMVAQLLAGARTVTAVPTVVYRYVLRSGSIIRSGRKRSESLLAVGAVVETAARSFGVRCSRVCGVRLLPAPVHCGVGAEGCDVRGVSGG